MDITSSPAVWSPYSSFSTILISDQHIYLFHIKHSPCFFARFSYQLCRKGVPFLCLKPTVPPLPTKNSSACICNGNCSIIEVVFHAQCPSPFCTFSSSLFFLIFSHFIPFIWLLSALIAFLADLSLIHHSLFGPFCPCIGPCSALTGREKRCLAPVRTYSINLLMCSPTSFAYPFYGIILL